MRRQVLECWWLEFVMQICDGQNLAEVARICDAEQYEEQCKKELSGSVRGLYESLVEKSRGKLHKAQQRRNTEMLQAEQPPKFTEAWKTFMFTHT